MNEDDVRLVRQIVKETVAEILDTEFYDPFFSMLDGCEAGITSFRRSVGKRKGVTPEAQERKAELPGSESLEGLPWRSYQTKQDAKPDEAAWIFANTKGAEALSAVLKTKDKAQIGTFEYSRSGPEKQFISRKPLKSKA